MMKESKVIFFDPQLEKAYNDMSDDEPLKKGIKKAIEELGRNCQAGENARKDSPILKYYKRKFKEMNIELNNIRIYDLPLYYRLIYSLVPSTEKIGIIISMIIDWKDHKDYDKLNK